MKHFLQELGWWLLPAVALAQLVAEPLRRWIRQRGHEARIDRAAVIILRRRLSSVDGDPTLRSTLLQRSRQARWEAHLASAVLVVIWLGAQITAWSVHLNARWTGLPRISWERCLIVAAVATGVCLLALWLVLYLAREVAALERAVAHVLSIALTSAVVGIAVRADAEPRTALSVLAIALSPLVRRIFVTSVRAPAPAVLPPEAFDLLAHLGRAAPPRPPPMEVVPATDLVVHGALDRRGHIREVTVAGFTEPLVFKQFEYGGTQPARNPVRPLASYTELLSRVHSLTSAERSVLLWPRAVVANGTVAVGVLYDRIGPPFVLSSGTRAQTGDFLLATEPEHSGCQVPDMVQRGQILHDVVYAHELLRRLDLAHGDTGWKNFVYGVESGRGRGMLIDIDGVTALDDPNPIRLHQLYWEVPENMPPARRDEYRVALLIARLAANKPEPNAWTVPDRAADWFTPLLRRLAAAELATPDRPPADLLTRLRTAIAQALRTSG